MLIIGGRRIYGKVEQVGRTFVATTFAFLQFLPLFPVQSHIVLGEGSADTHHVIPIKMHWKSVAVGYLRSWGVFFSLGSMFTFIGLLGKRVHAWSDFAGLAAADFMALVPIALTTAAFHFLGKLSVAEKAQRLVYARWAEHPVDVAVFDEDQRGAMLRRIREFLANRAAPTTTAQGYRKAVQVIDDWRVLALEPDMKDRAYLESAFTLSRIEASLAVGSRRAELSALHRRIWDKLVEEHPDTLEVAREAQALDGSSLRRNLGLLPLVAATALCGFTLLQNARTLMASGEAPRRAATESHEAVRERMKRTLWSLRHDGGPARQGWEQLRRHLGLPSQSP